MTLTKYAGLGSSGLGMKLFWEHCITFAGVKASGMTDFERFITGHGSDNEDRLILSRDRWPDIDMELAVSTIECRKRLKAKVPEWYAVTSLVYPDRLCAEQCSSSATARLKAEIAAKLITGPDRRTGRIADLTGGIGVDAWAFSKLAGKVLHNEAKSALHKAAAENFHALGADNIICTNHFLEPGNVSEILNGFRPDLIYLDPARRDSVGRKVFLLEDCSPDILGLKEELLDCAPLLMVKVSPMADISMLRSRLGEELRELFIVSWDGECKELLLILGRPGVRDIKMTIIDRGNSLTFNAMDEVAAKCALAGEILPGQSLFEPGKALMKAGIFSLLSQKYGLPKLGRSAHLYIGDDIPQEIAVFGKCQKILEVLPFNKRNIKELGRRYPRCEVTAKNLPLSSEELRKKMGSASGGAAHIYAVSADLAGKLLIVT